MKGNVLVVNSGSFSLKASLVSPDGSRCNFEYTHVGEAGFPNGTEAIARLLDEIDAKTVTAVGHRITHGGDVAEPARLIDAEERTRLDALAHLAPLHMPGNLHGVDLCARRLDVPQFGCFDTAFHRAMPQAARALPVPREYGLEKYGFYGLNFAHVARVLPKLLPEAAHGRIVVAHLGSGASLCLLQDLQSLDTTMGLTPLGGIPMGTRSGDLDPGVVLELARELRRSQVEELFYHRSGLLALSGGISADMAALLRDEAPGAAFAVDYFCRAVRGAIGGLAAKWGGIDGLIFTGGIGENAPGKRTAVCQPLDFLGLQLDESANAGNAAVLSTAASKPVLRVTADEEGVIAELVGALLRRTA
jgi:acetate kinase